MFFLLKFRVLALCMDYFARNHEQNVTNCLVLPGLGTGMVRLLLLHQEIDEEMSSCSGYMDK